MAKVSFNTDKDFKQNYKFMIGSILPRPIALVSTRNEDGSFNVLDIVAIVNTILDN